MPVDSWQLLISFFIFPKRDLGYSPPPFCLHEVSYVPPASGSVWGIPVVDMQRTPSGRSYTESVHGTPLSERSNSVANMLGGLQEKVACLFLIYIQRIIRFVLLCFYKSITQKFGSCAPRSHMNSSHSVRQSKTLALLLRAAGRLWIE